MFLSVWSSFNFNTIWSRLFLEKGYFKLQIFLNSHKLDDQIEWPHAASGYRIGHHCFRLKLIFTTTPVLLKILVTSKVIKRDSKIIILLRQFKFRIHTVGNRMVFVNISILIHRFKLWNSGIYMWLTFFQISK